MKGELYASTKSLVVPKVRPSLSKMNNNKRYDFNLPFDLFVGYRMIDLNILKICIIFELIL